MRQQGKCVAATCLVTLVAAGCAGPGAGIADRIRTADSPIVREVIFSPANPLEGSDESITVFLVTDASDAQVKDVWCHVVIPAGVEQLAPARVKLYKAGEGTADGGLTGMIPVPDKPICPGDSSPAPSG